MPKNNRAPFVATPEIGNITYYEIGDSVWETVIDFIQDPEEFIDLLRSDWDKAKLGTMTISVYEIIYPPEGCTFLERDVWIEDFCNANNYDIEHWPHFCTGEKVGEAVVTWKSDDAKSEVEVTNITINTF